MNISNIKLKPQGDFGMSLFKKTSLIIFISFLAIVSACIYIYLSPSQLEREFSNELQENLSVSQNITAAQLVSLKNYQKICIVLPYAINVSQSQDDLTKIFGEIDYARWESKLLQNADNDAKWMFYLVNNNSVVEALYMRSNIFTELNDFRSGCYTPASLCFQNTQMKTSKRPVVGVGSC